MSFTATILAAAKQAGVSGSLLLAICTHESGLKNTLVPHDGGSPTFGICQLKSGSAAQVGFEGRPGLLMLPDINAKYAALYLKYQLKRYAGDEYKALAAYNSGSYKESSRNPGQAVNDFYVRSVQSKIQQVAKEEIK